MIKAKVVKINEDDKTVLLLTEHGDEFYVSRYDIDFGILVGDSLFLRTESGKYKFRRLEKDEAQEGEPHYYDADWRKREDEHTEFTSRHEIEVEESTSKIIEEIEKENESNTITNMILAFVVFAIILIGFLILRS